MSVLAQTTFQIEGNGGPLFFFIVFVVVGVIFGGFTGWVAEENGRSGLTWFVLGFLFTFLALISLAIAPTKRRDERRS
jgi:hypothetical protein